MKNIAAFLLVNSIKSMSPIVSIVVNKKNTPQSQKL
jgi:hypothetical protein